MNIDRFHSQVRKFAYLFLLICLLTVNIGSVQAQSGCSVIYNGGNGWIIDMCTTDPAITTPMQVSVDGVPRGNAALIRIYHQTENGTSTPQVAVIYASGYVRLKQNANPSPSIPFGTSFILGLATGLVLPHTIITLNSTRLKLIPHGYQLRLCACM